MSNVFVYILLLQYLKYSGLDKSVRAFETECSEKGTPIASTEVTPKPSRQLSVIQVCLMSFASSDTETEVQFLENVCVLPQHLRCLVDVMFLIVF